ncbi:DNA ligase D [Roseateles asaccharophilus]|uniref:DNA ligase (ATP) n=1 Tax=Roseateles asaccharophilus TaxID=582607 RepID=A0ABU2A9W0_9BURK|nr:DNA ligase D [Roseateles asaccharophilus]MDR7333800.1 bifunctional non-homologous end joining protein LigD [Roseateles asaccharophilus]
MAADAPLARYNAKRNFKASPEPEGRRARRRAKALAFVIQKHWASHLHYDFRLELDGVMLSWAVPKGPSYDPAKKQMAIHVEDHPVSYNAFEGSIPKGHYGAGKVIIWDRGTWEPVGNARDGMKNGKLVFHLHGEKLAGLWELVRISKPGQFKQDHWLLFKKRGDAWARPHREYDVITALPDSVIEQPLGLAEDREPRGRAPRDAAPDLSQARRAALPQTLTPQLAMLATTAPADGDWVVESKFDGYRLLARVSAGKARLFTRQGNDWTAQLQPVATALQALKLGAGWYDGEIAMLGDNGLPDFNRLQNAIDKHRSEDIVYFLFDLPFHAGLDLRAVPLRSRRAALQQLLEGKPGDRIRFSPELPAAPAQMLAAACQLGLEGVMLKRADAPYVSKRSDTWLKLKCQRRQEFVVAGFSDRSNSPGEVGALLLGYHEGGRLRSAGWVGTGWNTAQGRELHQLLKKLETKTPQLDPAELEPGRWTKRKRGAERWVKPTLVVEVSFGEWTPDGHIRHASFRGVRTDKPPASITREENTAMTPPASRKTATVITHPDRVIDESTGLRKIDLVHYYESVADWLLPHLKARPVSLVRAPQGIAGPLFFQKHSEAKMPGVVDLDAALWPGHEPLLEIHTLKGIVSAAQMNVVEFHTWNAKIGKIDQPDRIVFDLDPGDGVRWPQLQEAARLMHTLLDELGLQSWLKTSGGKGLHVVVPLAPKLDADAVKAFSKAAVEHIAKAIPQRFVAKSGPANRVGKIFIDYLRNGHGQTTAAAFSARARPGMGVSMPVAWEQLDTLKSGAHWTVKTAREYLSFAGGDDPWAGYWKARQTLAAAVKRLQSA